MNTIPLGLGDRLEKNPAAVFSEFGRYLHDVSYFAMVGLVSKHRFGVADLDASAASEVFLAAASFLRENAVRSILEPNGIPAYVVGACLASGSFEGTPRLSDKECDILDRKVPSLNLQVLDSGEMYSVREV